ncbi:hypothetical protein A9R05_42380 (plasmid) [Burkholderia sp. KK1]|uniref:Uncharacterized protein n=1 Tax=Burkholderia sp. M701 TaxID=326454 RepID=V5YMV9_9BURK|nr:hypothetical protein [Burkholderia sp. M701]AQH05668.1 hypothetical protein A9R05_42380 [Burkholderia sp. KK1]BAO18915.1 hypothetical protein [Burkholderia sp. M701]
MRLKLWLPILLVAAVFAVSWKVKTNPIHTVEMDAANLACAKIDGVGSSSLIGVCGRIQAEWLGAEYAKAQAAALSDVVTTADENRYKALQSGILDADFIRYRRRVQDDLSQAVSRPAPKD